MGEVEDTQVKRGVKGRKKDKESFDGKREDCGREGRVALQDNTSNKLHRRGVRETRDALCLLLSNAYSWLAFDCFVMLTLLLIRIVTHPLRVLALPAF